MNDEIHRRHSHIKRPVHNNCASPKREVPVGTIHGGWNRNPFFGKAWKLRRSSVLVITWEEGAQMS